MGEGSGVTAEMTNGERLAASAWTVTAAMTVLAFFKLSVERGKRGCRHFPSPGASHMTVVNFAERASCASNNSTATGVSDFPNKLVIQMRRPMGVIPNRETGDWKSSEESVSSGGVVDSESGPKVVTRHSAARRGEVVRKNDTAVSRDFRSKFIRWPPSVDCAGHDN